MCCLALVPKKYIFFPFFIFLVVDQSLILTFVEWNEKGRVKELQRCPRALIQAFTNIGIANLVKLFDFSAALFIKVWYTTVSFYYDCLINEIQIMNDLESCPFLKVTLHLRLLNTRSCNHILNGNKGHYPGQLILAFVHTGWHITTL